MYNIYIIGQPISPLTYRATVVNLLMQDLVLLIFIVSIHNTVVMIECSIFYIYSCLFPCKTAREYFLAVLFLFEIS